MDGMEIMERRHSVRQYEDRPLAEAAVEALAAEIAACNREGGLSIQLALEEPAAFTGLLAKYGSFRGVRNYLVLAGPKGPDLEERAGYYGERLVLLAERLGLNTCWVGATYRKGKCRCTLGPGEKLVCVVALGYGAVRGKPHKSKPLTAVCAGPEPWPEWFRRGGEAALLAPTALNQQKFRLTLEEGGAVRAVSTGGAYSKVDLGIVKYHFELGAGGAAFAWR